MLHNRFRRYHDPDTHSSESPELIRKIYPYTIWCTKAESYAVQEQGWMCIYEDLPRLAVSSNPEIYKKITEDFMANLPPDYINSMSSLIAAEGGKFEPATTQAREQKFWEDCQTCATQP